MEIARKLAERRNSKGRLISEAEEGDVKGDPCHLTPGCG